MKVGKKRGDGGTGPGSSAYIGFYTSMTMGRIMGFRLVRL